ncbi:hypothetical protein [Nostoc sp.]|uniref:hypothetical protein n=1 Tax=Nostoc sp. TaxID=1180 RepID=UPI002FFBBC3D
MLSAAVGVVSEFMVSAVELRSRTPPGKQATRSVSKSCAASRREVALSYYSLHERGSKLRAAPCREVRTTPML